MIQVLLSTHVTPWLLLETLAPYGEMKHLHLSLSSLLWKLTPTLTSLHYPYGHPARPTLYAYPCAHLALYTPRTTHLHKCHPSQTTWDTSFLRKPVTGAKVTSAFP